MGFGVSLDPRDQPGATWARLCDWVSSLGTPRGTFVFDCYRGWTRPQLKRRCRELAMVVDRYQHMTMAMAATPGSLDKLHPDDRAVVERLIEAHATTTIGMQRGSYDQDHGIVGAR